MAIISACQSEGPEFNPRHLLEFFGWLQNETKTGWLKKMKQKRDNWRKSNNYESNWKNEKQQQWRLKNEAIMMGIEKLNHNEVFEK